MAGTERAAPRDEAPDVAAAVAAWCRRLEDAHNLLRLEESRCLALRSDRDGAARLGAALRGEPLDADALARWAGAPPAQGDRLGRLVETARRNREEQGIETLHLLLGRATWRPAGDGDPPLAPVLLLAADLTPSGLRPLGQPLLNPALEQALQRDFGCALDEADLADRLRSGGLPALADSLRQAAAAVPGLGVREDILLGHIGRHAWELSAELAQRGPDLGRHPLVAALAGHSASRALFRSSGSAPAAAPPPRLVLAADASQRAVVDAARAGLSCRVEGPPGCGKSQTVANAAAALVADGRQVLIAAAKRSALDAVRMRLEGRGLGALVLDLGGADMDASPLRRRIAAALEHSVGAPDDALAREEELRGERARLERALHLLTVPRPPSGLSAIDLRDGIVRAPQAVRAAGLPAHPELARLDARTARHVALLLADTHDLRDLLLGTADSPWAAWSAQGESAATRALDLAASAAAAAERAEAALVTLQARLPGLRPRSLQELWRAAELLAAVRQSLGRYDDAVWQLDLAACTERRSPARRQALAALRRLRLRRDAGRGALLEDAAELQRQRALWPQVTGQAGPPRALAEAADLQAALDALRPPLLRLSALLGPDAGLDRPLGELHRRLRALAADRDTPHRIPRARAVQAELAGHGAWGAARDIIGGLEDPKLYPQAFDLLWRQAHLDAVRRAEPALPALGGGARDSLLEALAALRGREAAAAAQATLRLQERRAAEALSGHPDQVQHVRAALAGGASLRALLAGAPDVLQALFPCWLASPWSVARLIDGDRPRFDAVIFDEAGQLPVELALPAIWRGRQAIVVGDALQLPPLPFRADVGADAAPAQAGPADTQSLLERADFLPALRLHWHYRSRDEALFGFANRRIYGTRVTTLPGVRGHGAGLRCVRAASAAEEAALVADLARREAAAHPEESVVVLTLDAAHAARVQGALEQARANGDAPAGSGERGVILVKPIDRAQGEEWDAVILSLGRDLGRSGGAAAALGELAGALGPSRLTVAMTRARERLTLVAAFGHEDLAAAGFLPPGLGLLRDYLQYVAQRDGGRMAQDLTDEPVNPLEEELSPFQEEVYEALRHAGIDAVPQYGALRHRIDFALRDPADSGRFVLALACDGAERHLAPSLRQEDRLGHLGALGWAVHRTWAADWAEDRERELQRIREALRQAAAARRLRPAP